MRSDVEDRVDSGALTGYDADDFGQMDVEAAEQLYEALRAVREKHRPPGKKMSDNAAWEEKLRSEVDETLQKARGAVRNTDDSVAQRAVQLMLRTDLVNACSARLSSVLRHIKMKEVADLLTTIWHSYASISKDWEGLLQDQEESLEGALESKEEEAAREVQALEGRLEEAHVRIDESARLLAARDREVESLRRQIDDLRRQLAAASTRRAASAERQQPAGAAQGEPAPPPADKAQRGDDGAAGRVESRASTGMSKGSRRGKEMTRSKVLEIVREIYKSKDRSDELFREGKQERETMEEHLYRFMNNKFGLRGLIIEHVESLLAGVQRFRDSAVEIALFSKILSNQVEEELRFEMDAMRRSLVEVLRQILAMKFPGSSSFQREKMLKERTEGLIPQEEAFVIVKSMQSADESAEVASILQAKLEGRVVRHGKDLRTDEERMTHPHAMTFDEFVEVVLAVHLRHHEAKIRDVVESFRRVDIQSRGFLDEGQFRDFCRGIDSAISEQQLDTLLDVLDPQGTGRVTFSSCVSSLVPHAA